MFTNDEIATWPETVEFRQTPPEAVIDLLIRWLATKNRRKNFLATKGLVHLGPHVFHRLILEVSSCSPGHTLRILDVLEQIGLPLGVDEFFSLNFVLRSRSEAVRRRIVEVIQKSQQAVPQTPSKDGDESGASPLGRLAAAAGVRAAIMCQCPPGE